MTSSFARFWVLLGQRAPLACLAILGSVLLATVGGAEPAVPLSPSKAPPIQREELARLDRERWPDELHLQAITPQLRGFMESLRRGSFDLDRSPSILGSGFVGSPLPKAAETVREANGVSVTRWQTSAAPSLDRSQFEEAWLAYSGEFDVVERTEFHVSRIDLLPETSPGRLQARLAVDFRLFGREDALAREDQGSLLVEFGREADSPHWSMGRLAVEQLVTVRGTARFRDANERVRLAEGRAETLFVAYFGEGVSLADFDSDGDLDLFFPSRYGPAVLYRNDGAGPLHDATEEVGLAGRDDVRSGYFFDLDNDGDLDLLLLTRQRIYLFENEDSRFSDISKRSGFDEMSTGGLTGAAVADYDGDGLLEFYVANYGDPNQGPGFGYLDSSNGFFNKLFRNSGGGVFEDVTDSSGLGADNRRWTYAAIWIDADDDNGPDLYVVNDYGPNQLFRNRLDGTFVDVADALGVSDFGNGMGASWGDYDGDGRFDLYVSNMHSYAGARVTRAPGFGDDPEVRQRAQRFAKGNTLFRGTGSGRFVEVDDTAATQAGWAWGNAFFDYDNDGDLDLYVADGMFSNVNETDS